MSEINWRDSLLHPRAIYGVKSIDPSREISWQRDMQRMGYNPFKAEKEWLEGYAERTALASDKRGAHE